MVAADPGLTGRRRIVSTLTLGGLAVAQAMVGGWALLAPENFYAAFPAAGHAWVSLLPPFNEHLIRDAGALSLALAVLLAVAAVRATHVLVRTAVVAFAVYSVPHTVFHGLHLDGFSSADAVGQMAGFALQLVLAGVALLSTVGATSAREANDSIAVNV